LYLCCYRRHDLVINSHIFVTNQFIVFRLQITLCSFKLNVIEINASQKECFSMH